ncbi:hypothetical protein [Mycolicibacterium parafortuitum]|uniref:PASTA domain-containing protein n=1 Tax=Mycolicibacterium parafortuitum TaxID=39692 RepID=A0A375YHN6_MYCPF|nr:hypothetical protein [Mycolicibacterium parafortuitum]ORB30644.1 hypothetical protein BST38_10210 [Mycolicibacterium parafortuitum]SRX80610.1 hypothetical protein MPP7335_02354 [Mycolicibacterium parafortuitum]
MERKGFKRQGRNIAAAVASFGMLAGGIVVAPVAGAQTSTWTMPALRGEVLERAVNSVVGAAGEDNVRFNIYDSVHNQVVYNYTNWVVCGQSPRADATVKVGSKPQRVTFALKRRYPGC